MHGEVEGEVVHEQHIIWFVSAERREVLIVRVDARVELRVLAALYILEQLYRLITRELADLLLKQEATGLHVVLCAHREHGQVELASFIQSG